MFIRDTWYVVAHSADVVREGVLGRTVLDESVVVFRRGDGSLGALENRCPHRLLPLSMGQVVGNDLRCGYHGATFDASGRCVSIPGGTAVPRGARVRHYPVIERCGFVWVWPGEPAHADDGSSIPEFLSYGVDPFDAADGQMLSFAADYRLIVDNLLDAGHASFVHATTFGAPLWTLSPKEEGGLDGQDADFQFDIKDDGIDYRFSARNTIVGPVFAQAYARKVGRGKVEDRLDIDLDVQWAAPSLFIFSSVTRGVGEGREEGVGLINLHALTPETAHSTHYFFRNAYRFLDKSDEFKSFWHEAAIRAFTEDKIVIETQQQSIGERNLFDHKLVSFPGDRLGIQGRRILDRLEKQGSAERSAGHTAQRTTA